MVRTVPAASGPGGAVVSMRGEVIPEPVSWYVPKNERTFRMKPLKRGGSPENGPHQQMFLDAVRSHRKPPMCDVEMGHLSTIPGHLANISYRLGNEHLLFDATKENFINSTEANELDNIHHRSGFEIN